MPTAVQEGGEDEGEGKGQAEGKWIGREGENGEVWEGGKKGKLWKKSLRVNRRVGVK